MCFATKIGLGVCRQAKQKASYNVEISVECVKARWTPEESYLLAKLEVELLRERIQNINQALHSILQECNRDKSVGRTYDSIKNHRKQSTYRTTVAHPLAVAGDQPQGTTAASRWSSDKQRELRVGTQVSSDSHGYTQQKGGH